MFWQCGGLLSLITVGSAGGLDLLKYDCGHFVMVVPVAWWIEKSTALHGRRIRYGGLMMLIVHCVLVFVSGNGQIKNTVQESHALIITRGGGSAFIL